MYAKAIMYRNLKVSQKTRLKNVEKDPITDYVENPLKKLADLARKEKIDVNGLIEVRSDYSDYDNLTIEVSAGGLRFYNSELLNADTEALIEELKRRGFDVSFQKTNTANKR